MSRRIYEYAIPFLYTNRLRRDYTAALKATESILQRAQTTIDDYAGVIHKQNAELSILETRKKAAVDAARALEDAAMGVINACQGELIVIEGDKDDPEPEMYREDPDLNVIRKAAEALGGKATRVSSLLLGIIEPTPKEN